MPGSRWKGKGKVKEYDDNINLILEGEYLNGKIYKKYEIIRYNNGKIKYESEYLFEKNGM